MASAGFEFGYMLDGSNATPVIRDFTLGETTAYKAGDVVLIQSDGYADKVTASVAEVTGIMQESITPASAGATSGKVAIVTSQQVWRCSTDASSCAAVTGYTKTVDLADQNTIDADDITNGSMIKVDAGTDDDGNVLLYVVFPDTTFGNG
jgi:hypothetical protein